MSTPSLRPEIIAHRGASRERPENTLAAFRRAVELGADGVELDVHRTADDVIVVHHDPEVTDPAGHRVPIASLDSAALRAFRVQGEPIPTLANVLEVIAGKLQCYCELKGKDTARGTLALLQRVPASSAVHAFDHRQIAEARRLAPSIARGVLEASYPVHGLHALQAVEGRDLWRHWEHIDEGLVQQAHAVGARVIAWTVNEPTVMTRLAAWGVDGVCTDDVALARATLTAATRA